MVYEKSKLPKSNWRVYLITRLEDMKDRIDALLTIIPPADYVASDVLVHLASELTQSLRIIEED